MTTIIVALPLISLLVDMGLFILIWIVQLVVYPGFVFYSEKDLKRWHATYTRRITIVVLPLMIGQLGLTLYESLMDGNVIIYSKCACILVTWLITFLVAVPLHRRIDQDASTLETRQKLIRVNMYRTILWTIIFILSYWNYGA